MYDGTYEDYLAKLPALGSSKTQPLSARQWEMMRDFDMSCATGEEVREMLGLGPDELGAALDQNRR